MHCPWFYWRLWQIYEMPRNRFSTSGSLFSRNDVRFARALTRPEEYEGVTFRWSTIAHCNRSYTATDALVTEGLPSTVYGSNFSSTVGVTPRWEFFAYAVDEFVYLAGLERASRSRLWTPVIRPRRPRNPCATTVRPCLQKDAGEQATLLRGRMTRCSSCRLVIWGRARFSTVQSLSLLSLL